MESTGSITSVAEIILACATFLGVIFQGIVSLRTKKVVDEAKFERASADKKIDALTDQVTLVATHTNSMKDELIATTKELATLKERARTEEEARKVLIESQARVEAAVTARMAGMAEGSRIEKEKHERPSRG